MCGSRARLTRAGVSGCRSAHRSPSGVAVSSPAPSEAPKLDRLAGEISPPLEQMLQARLPEVLAVRGDPSAWELSRKKVG